MTSDGSPLLIDLADGVLWITLNRPEVRNAMSFAMVDALRDAFERAESEAAVRCVVLGGAGGHFCAGGDVGDMKAVGDAPPGDSVEDDALAAGNRRFGEMLERADGLRVPLIAALEGAVLGGGFGLACVSDIAIAAKGAQFGLPETGLGLTPAQIAPFVARRIGLTQARRLAVTGLRIDAVEARRIGIIHEAVDDADALSGHVHQAITRVMRGAPGAIAETKRLMRAVAGAVPPEVLDHAAMDFAGRVRGQEGKEGMAAFRDKRPAAWTPEAWRGDEQ